MVGVALVLGLVAPQAVGGLVLCAFRTRLGMAALLGSFASAVTFFVMAGIYWAHQQAVVTATRGEPPCGAFGALMIVSMFGGGFLHFGTTAAAAGFVALLRRSRR